MAEEYKYILGKPLSIEDVIIPDNSIFKEEFEILLYLAEKDEDYDEIQLKMYVPLTIEEISAFENRTGIKLTEELKAFYQITNGYQTFVKTSFDCLEQVEQFYNIGYGDWSEEGDSEDYVVLGSDGVGYYLLMKLETGEIIQCDDEGELTNFGTLKEFLYNEIYELSDCFEAAANDEKVNDYLERNK